MSASRERICTHLPYATDVLDALFLSPEQLRVVDRKQSGVFGKMLPVE